jgi:hypothetical protein
MFGHEGYVTNFPKGFQSFCLPGRSLTYFLLNSRRALTYTQAGKKVTVAGCRADKDKEKKGDGRQMGATNEEPWGPTRKTAPGFPPEFQWSSALFSGEPFGQKRKE